MGSDKQDGEGEPSNWGAQKVPSKEELLAER